MEIGASAVKRERTPGVVGRMVVGGKLGAGDMAIVGATVATGASVSLGPGCDVVSTKATVGERVGVDTGATVGIAAVGVEPLAEELLEDRRLLVLVKTTASMMPAITTAKTSNRIIILVERQCFRRLPPLKVPSPCCVLEVDPDRVCTDRD